MSKLEKGKFAFRVCMGLLYCTTAAGAPGTQTVTIENPETDPGWFSFTPSYKTIYEMKVQPLDVTGVCSGDGAQAVALPPGTLFRETLDHSAQGDKENAIDVYSVPIKSTDDQTAKRQEFFSKPFRLCKDGQQKVEKSYYEIVGGLDTGLLVIPYKFRDGDIYSDSTIGPYLSYRTEVAEWLVTFGLSQISISEVGTDDVETRSGLTLAFGISLEIDTNWDIAFIVGADHLSGETGDNWEFQDEPWISAAIGFNFTRE